MKDKIIQKLKLLNQKAIKNGDIPVSCIITKNEQVIATGYNKKYKNNCPFDHAEILAIKKACKKLNTNNLMDCELFVTLIPCKMCQGAIEEARIKSVYYILNKTKEINNTTKYEQMYAVNNSDFFKEIQDFFKDKR